MKIDDVYSFTVRRIENGFLVSANNLAEPSTFFVASTKEIGEVVSFYIINGKWSVDSGE